MTALTWVIAVLCSAAVGARLGRLTVRPPSLGRTSVAIAAVATSAAAAVRTPTVSVILGPPGSQAPTLAFAACWVAVAAATALIAVSAWPPMGRRSLRVAAVVVPTAAVADVVAMSVTGQVAVASVFVVAAGLFSLAVGARYVAWTPLGRAIAYYLAGVAMAVAVLLTDLTRIDPTSGWWAAVIIVLSAACCSVMVESWFVARRDLRKTDALWATIEASHPEIADPDYRSTTTVLQADDRVSQILDGLYLHAGAGLAAPTASADEADPRTRARQIAAWLGEGAGTPLAPEILTTPEQFSDRRWVRLLAHEYARVDAR
ncbi:MAG: hypothetical protein WBA05_10260 [Gordonia sp. (in: high G+C Gram-positive bacteria)]|uniref:hypothetical protein n=1 Tax=Gordonia TaxID=2053 RepID=UPI00326745FE